MEKNRKALSYITMGILTLFMINVLLTVFRLFEVYGSNVSSQLIENGYYLRMLLSNSLHLVLTVLFIVVALVFSFEERNVKLIWLSGAYAMIGLVQSFISGYGYSYSYFNTLYLVNALFVVLFPISLVLYHNGYKALGTVLFLLFGSLNLFVRINDLVMQMSYDWGPGTGFLVVSVIGIASVALVYYLFIAHYFNVFKKRKLIET